MQGEERKRGVDVGERPDEERSETKAAGSSQEIREDIKSTIVYLTADSDEELVELKETETYIIGGICDHNRYKVRNVAPFLDVLNTYYSH
jgi:Trm5-related predicted tRNA methylase